MDRSFRRMVYSVTCCPAGQKPNRGQPEQQKDQQIQGGQGAVSIYGGEVVGQQDPHTGAETGQNGAEPSGPAQSFGSYYGFSIGRQAFPAQHSSDGRGMGLLRVGQLPTALHWGKVHLVCRQLKALVEHSRDQVEIPGSQDRSYLFVHQGFQRGKDHVGEGVIQSKDTCQFSLDGAEYCIFDMESLGKFYFHQIHKGGGADQNLVAANGCGQTASFIAAQMLSVSEDGSLCPEQIMKQLGEAAA